MPRHARPALSLLLLLAPPLAAQSSLDEMLNGIRAYLLRQPVLSKALPAHPLLLAADHCDPTRPRETLVLLSYRKLDCKDYPGIRVIAPRLIHPGKRERIRRMGAPFAQVPLGYELAAYYDALKRHKQVRIDPPLKQLFGKVDSPRPQENAFGIGIRPHDETTIERATDDTTAIETYLLDSIPSAEARRTALMRTSPEEVARRWHTEVTGVLPAFTDPIQPRERSVAENSKFTAISITIEALPGVIAQGILLHPTGMRPFERRPLVIVQHGLMGTPESLFLQPTDSKDYRTYRNFAERLVQEGFIVYCPQNPYSGDFRPLQLLANPRGLSLFSFIEAQYRRTLDYLEKLPIVDANNMVFYGLSYGGTTALRVPVFDPRFKAIVCGGNFNEWIRKLVSPKLPYSYIHTAEYEIYEWNMANVASHAELAALGLRLHAKPIPFLVERGHQDPVGADEWVEYEFLRLATYAPTPGLVALAFFDGPHRTDGAAAIPFLKAKH